MLHIKFRDNRIWQKQEKAMRNLKPSIIELAIMLFTALIWASIIIASTNAAAGTDNEQLINDRTEAQLVDCANTGTNLLTNRLKVLSSTSSLAEVANEDVINPAKTETILVIQPDNGQGEAPKVVQPPKGTRNAVSVVLQNQSSNSLLQDNKRPNIVLFQVDNLGLGELGCYGGGMMRGANTSRIDQFSREGMQLWHYIAETQCTPSRSALMTGRHSIRSGTSSCPMDGGPGGLVAWEKTMADVLSPAGYATACFGKWHIGAETGRWPTDHGFDEWYGPPRSYDECLWPSDPTYDPKVAPPVYMLEGRKNESVQELHDQQLTIPLKRDVDQEYKRRAFDFMRRNVNESKPFFLYFNHGLMHLPTVPREEFSGKSGHGDNADCLMELDHDFGEILDFLDSLGIRNNTIVVFVGDNGPEDMLLWRGTSGIFEGSYFTPAEGGLRTPCLIRWPGHVPAGSSNNEMVHQVDMFPTLLGWAGCMVPQDRVIDGIDQRSFFLGQQNKSNREGCLVWFGDKLCAVKWRNFKVTFVDQKYLYSDALPVGTPHIIDLITDPKEREPADVQYLHTWVLQPIAKLEKNFKESVSRESLIPAGSPVDFVPDHQNKTEWGLKSF
jgi:arylsulfatase